MGFWKQGKWAYISREQREVSATFEGNKQTKKMLGNMEPRKTNFRFLGTSKFISAPPPPPPREGLDGLVDNSAKVQT